MEYLNIYITYDKVVDEAINILMIEAVNVPIIEKKPIYQSVSNQCAGH